MDGDMYSLTVSSITTPQDVHKLVLQVAEWLTASLPGLARHDLFINLFILFILCESLISHLGV